MPDSKAQVSEVNVAQKAGFFSVKTINASLVLHKHVK